MAMELFCLLTRVKKKNLHLVTWCPQVGCRWHDLKHAAEIIMLTEKKKTNLKDFHGFLFCKSNLSKLTLPFLFYCYLMSFFFFPSCVQLPGGCSDESGPRWPPDQRPHVLRVDPGQTEAIHLPAAGPPQLTQQAGAAPGHDAAGTRQPLVLVPRSRFPHHVCPRMF